jgi:hypothetical protein
LPQLPKVTQKAKIQQILDLKAYAYDGHSSRLL